MIYEHVGGSSRKQHRQEEVDATSDAQRSRVLVVTQFLEVKRHVGDVSREHVTDAAKVGGLKRKSAYMYTYM